MLPPSWWIYLIDQKMSSRTHLINRAYAASRNNKENEFREPSKCAVAVCMDKWQTPGTVTELRLEPDLASSRVCVLTHSILCFPLRLPALRSQGSPVLGSRDLWCSRALFRIFKETAAARSTFSIRRAYLSWCQVSSHPEEPKQVLEKETWWWTAHGAQSRADSRLDD